MIDNKSVMQQAIDSLIESSRLLGAIQDKKLCGTYTQIDSIFEATCYEIIEAKRQTILDAIAQPVEPHDLQKRLEALHQYEDIAEHYAKCLISPEGLRDWVAERMDMPAIAQSVDPDDLTIAYMSGLEDGKKAAQEKELK